MNVEPMPSVLAKISQLKPSTYQYHQDGLMADATVMYGFMAQDVAMVFPHMVRHHVDYERQLEAYTIPRKKSCFQPADAASNGVLS